MASQGNAPVSKYRAPISVEYDDVVRRVASWSSSDTYELHYISQIIQVLYNQHQRDEVKTLALAMLQHEDLPALIKAKMYAYLAEVAGPERNAWEDITIAEMWIREAKRLQDTLGYVVAEVETWMEIVNNCKIDTARELGISLDQGEGDAITLPLRPAGYALGDVDGTSEAPLNEGQPTGGQLQLTQQVKHEQRQATEAEQERVRRSLAKAPKSIRRQRSIAAFHTGKGSAGVLQSFKDTRDRVASASKRRIASASRKVSAAFDSKGGDGEEERMEEDQRLHEG